MNQQYNLNFHTYLQPVSAKKVIKNQSKLKNKKYIQNIQLVPRLDQKININKQSQEKISKQDQIDYKSRDFQDSNLTKFINGQIIVIKLSMMIMTILSIVLSLLSQQIIQQMGQKYEQYILIIHSLISTSLIIFSVMKSIKNQQLAQKQLIKNISQINYLERLQLCYILQVLFLLIHPNLLTKQIIIRMQQPINGEYIPSQVNKIFQIIMMLRIYLIFNAFISSTTYLSTRANRICRIYGTKNTIIFGMKCIFNQQPLSALFIIFNILLFVLANMVKLSQSYGVNNGLNQYKNSLWCVVITMGTVGYGQYSPTTYLGRIILFLASLAGIIMSSLLILTLSTYLSMQLSQNKSHITLQRLILRQNLQKLAKQVIGLTTKFYNNNSNNKSNKSSDVISNKSSNSSNKSNKSNNKSSSSNNNVNSNNIEQNKQKRIKQLKKKSDQVHHMNRKIKNLIDTDNINQQMNRFFQSLSDNMYQIYQRQVKNAILMQKLKDNQKIQQLQFSFTNQIQKLIKDR